jgi:hypothetical protein
MQIPGCFTRDNIIFHFWIKDKLVGGWRVPVPLTQ